jgi:hypothetical protein
MNRRTLFISTLVFTAGIASVGSAVDKGKAKFMGGTLTGIQEKTDGPIDLKGDDALRWFGDKGAGRVEIPWRKVTEMEYGQKVGMRWRSAILLSPLALFSKARKHFVTVSFKDLQNKEQAAVFEFDKDEIRMAMASFRARTGKEFVFQDEQAQKQMGGGAEKK